MLADVGMGDDGDANATAAILYTLASFTRNLPVEQTHLLDLGGADSPSPYEIDVVNLLFLVSDRYWPDNKLEKAMGSCRPCRQIFQRAIGLLTDLAINDVVVHTKLRSRSAAHGWIGVLLNHL
jgi:hypothetical protein